MNVTSAHSSQRRPSGEPAAQRPAFLRGQHRDAPTSGRRWRDVAIEDSLYSTGPLAAFLVAALFVVGAVWLLTAVPTFWMLALAAAMHGAASVLVLAVTMKLLSEDDPTPL